MVLWSPLVARLDDGARGAADISARADFEMVRADLRRHARFGSVWELRILAREPFRPVELAASGLRRERIRLSQLDLAGPDGTIALRDVVMVGDAVRRNLVVKRLTVAGFGDEPRVTETGGMLQLQAEGLSATLRGARVDHSSSRLITVTWDASA